MRKEEERRWAHCTMHTWYMCVCKQSLFVISHYEVSLVPHTQTTKSWVGPGKRGYYAVGLDKLYSFIDPLFYPFMTYAYYAFKAFLLFSVMLAVIFGDVQ